MAYTILKSDGTTLVTIPDGTVDNSSSISLPGANYVGYGLTLDENLVHMMENFASTTPPSGSIQGQLWFDKITQTLNVYSTSGYTPISGVTTSTNAPVSPKDGSIWMDTATNQLFVGAGGVWDLIGPQYTKTQGISGAIPISAIDVATGFSHNLIQIQFGSVIYAIFNADVAFVPQTTIAGFPHINSGITLSNLISGVSLNSSITGNVVGNVSGNVVGNLTGNVSGNLTGNVSGNVVGNLTGNVVGNINGTTGTITTLSNTNFSSGNVVITGGAISGVTNLSCTTSHITNFSSANTIITGGSLTNMSVVQTANLTATGGTISVSSVTAPTGSISALTGTSAAYTTVSATTAQLTNISSANLVATGGQITNLTNLTTTTAYTGTLTTPFATITGGSATGLVQVSATTMVGSSITSGNATITGGHLSNIIGANIAISGGAFTTSTATTPAYTDNSTSLATTAFVHQSVPTGVIWMWNSTSGTIPTGFQLCDGSNGTPDLRDRFVVGAGLSYAVGATGGNVTNVITQTNMPAHTHSVSVNGTTNNAGGHNHTINDGGHAHTPLGNQGQFIVTDSANTSNNVNMVGGQFATYNGGGTTSTSHTGVSNNSVADHAHQISISGTSGSAGSGSSIENRPPYYSLCYIQKMF